MKSTDTASVSGGNLRNDKIECGAEPATISSRSKHSTPAPHSLVQALARLHGHLADLLHREREHVSVVGRRRALRVVLNYLFSIFEVVFVTTRKL